MNTEIEFKATKMLCDLQGRLLFSVRNKVIHTLEYNKSNPEEVIKQLEYIANPEKWEYCGLFYKSDTAIMEVLEYLLNDDLAEVRKYKAPKFIEK